MGLIASCKSKICYHHDVVGDVRQTTANTNYDQRGSRLIQASFRNGRCFFLLLPDTQIGN